MDPDKPIEDEDVLPKEPDKCDCIDLFGDIGEYWGEVSLASVNEALSRAKGDLEIRINSLGGDSFMGIAIYNAISDWKAKTGKKVTCKAIGVAASAASLVFLAGDECVLADGALLMVHNCWTMAWGSAEDLLKTVGMMDKVNESYASIYAAKFGLPVEKCKELMSAETWLSGSDLKNLSELSATTVDSRLKAKVSELKSRLKWRDAAPVLAQAEAEVAAAKSEAEAASKLASEVSSALADTRSKLASSEAAVAEFMTASEAARKESRDLKISTMLDSASREGRLEPGQRAWAVEMCVADPSKPTDADISKLEKLLSGLKRNPAMGVKLPSDLKFEGAHDVKALASAWGVSEAAVKTVIEQQEGR